MINRADELMFMADRYAGIGLGFGDPGPQRDALRTALAQALAEARESGFEAGLIADYTGEVAEQAQPEPVEWVDDLPRLVYEAIGEASMQWHPRPTGVFASSEASAVCDRLIADVRALYAAKEPT